MTKYKDRLGKLMLERGISRTDLAAAIGISYQGVRKVFDSDGAFGSANNLKAAQYFGVNPLWLATGQGAREPDIAPEPPRQPGAAASPTAMEIALLYDLIPAHDRIRRTQAYNAATAAILSILQSPSPTAGEEPQK